MRLSLFHATALLALALCARPLPAAGLPAQSDPAPPPGQLRLDLGENVTMEFVLIPAGTFVMGSSDGDSDEAPPRQVAIEKPFYLGVREVSQAEWSRLVPVNPSRFPGPRRPVDNVSWIDAKNYLSLLSKFSPGPCRLPTEAEWEYACRAGTADRWSFGDDIAQTPRHAWFGDNSLHATRPVGTKSANPFGLYDMHGNISEWCEDWYAMRYAASPGASPSDPAEGTARVLRGGNWSSSARDVRSSARNCLDPTRHTDGTGFRCLIEIPPSPPSPPSAPPPAPPGPAS